MYFVQKEVGNSLSYEYTQQINHNWQGKILKNSSVFNLISKFFLVLLKKPIKLIHTFLKSLKS